MDSINQIDELMLYYYINGGKVTYCPLSIVRGFPIDWNPGGRDPFVQSPQYPDALRKVAESRKAYNKREKR